ncbi:hypothetical protein ILUMI_27350 [Ignelater luminosus]|uniref:Uncharacterized protein n=1 Tax=Ignelater luminosus TaxID=2038154 RepID=A0A8K0FXU5_IGNLU|nr:hypothetical protein ILUMI_27350 [Ignelater luminosus]
MEELLFGLTFLDLRQLVYQLAVKNHKKHNFSTKKELVGVDWLKEFLNHFLAAETINIPFNKDRPSTSNHANLRSTDIQTEPQPVIERQPQSSAHPAPAVITSLPDHHTPIGSPSYLNSSEPQPETSYNYIEPESDPSRLYVTEARSPIRTVCSDLASSFENVSLRDVISIASVQAKEKRKQYRRGKTAVITSTACKKGDERYETASDKKC